ncbi:MAG TPA: hypothetical protein VEH30_12980, partial [Terriglobales bacterium]|nr:hypothetical protein [Terriglobales bacterium]
HGPISFEMPKPSPDGRKLYAIGTAPRGELVHYDARTHQFVPYFSGKSAIQPTVSRDGKWIAYVSFPDHALWRANVDGSGGVQLTFPPMMVFYPQISPDATKIAFSGLTETGLGLYVLSKDSGKLEKLADFGHSPMWSPDGNSLVFGAMVSGKRFWDEPPWCEIHTIDLRTRKISAIADPSGSRYAPWWPSPSQIIALGVEDDTYHLYDLNTRKWTSVGDPIDLGGWTPSADGTSLYLLVDSPELAVFRMRTPDFRIEKVADLADVRITFERSLGPISSGHWIGVAVDGSPAVTRDVGSSEIYALDVKWP